jgi:hypothetical protein
MTEESGDKFFPIWLLVDSKHPNDITNIWNPIMYEIQETVFRKLHARINSRNVFIKNIVSDIGSIHSESTKVEVTKTMEMLRQSIFEYQPRLLFTFDAITNEYVNRALAQRLPNDLQYWHTRNLDYEFRHSTQNFNSAQINLIPLIRRKADTSKVINDWPEYGNSYIIDVSAKIAEMIINNRDNLNIWI